MHARRQAQLACSAAPANRHLGRILFFPATLFGCRILGRNFAISTSKQAGAIMAQIQIPLFIMHALSSFSHSETRQALPRNQTRFNRNQTPKASAAGTARARIDSPRPSFQRPNHQPNPSNHPPANPAENTRPAAAQAHSPSSLILLFRDPSSTKTFLFCFTVHVTGIPFQ
jgi:hypothetical protein